MVQNRNLEGTDMDMSTNKQLRPFGMRDKIGYAFGDFGCNELCVH